MSSGRSLTLTADHRVLVDLNSAGKQWREAGTLSVGAQVVVGVRHGPQLDAESRGWLGGFLDGEGTLSGIQLRPTRKSYGMGHLSFAQNPGPVLDKAVRLCAEADLPTSNKCPVGRDGRAVAMYLLGGVQSSLRMLCEVPSIRLRTGFVRLIEAGDIHATALAAETVLEIEDVGERNVVDIQTSTATFIANGYVVHNCGKDNTAQIELLGKRIEALRAMGRYEYYQQMESPIDPALLELSLRGIRVDEPGRAEEFIRVKTEALEVAKQINEVAGMKIVAKTAASPSALKVFLYEKLRLPAQYTKNAKKEKVVSTNVVTLRRLMDQFPGLAQLQEVGKLVLQHRRLGIVANSVKPEGVGANGRVYAMFRQDTVLGRLSSSATPKRKGSRNLQNVDRKLRKYFLADTGTEND